MERTVTTVVSRRTLIGAGTLLGAGALTSLTGCAAAAPVVFNPVTDSWLAELATTIGAQVAASEITKGIDAAWQSWFPKLQSTLDTIDSPFIYDQAFGHPVPPVVLVGLCQTKDSHPETDRLAAFVNAGTDCVVFEPWAWQALSMFTHALVDNRKDDDLAAYKALGALALAPSGKAAETGKSSQGSVSYMTYEARYGTVEISRLDSTVQVSASGIPTASGAPTVKKFDLQPTSTPSP